MSGYCPECGNQLCICKEIEAEYRGMKSENPQAYLVTVPYEDLRRMESKDLLLNDVINDLSLLIAFLNVDSEEQKIVFRMLETIKTAQQNAGL